MVDGRVNDTYDSQLQPLAGCIRLEILVREQQSKASEIRLSEVCYLQ